MFHFPQTSRSSRSLASSAIAVQYNCFCLETLFFSFSIFFSIFLLEACDAAPRFRAVVPSTVSGRLCGDAAVRAAFRGFYCEGNSGRVPPPRLSGPHERIFCFEKLTVVFFFFPIYKYISLCCLSVFLCLPLVTSRRCCTLLLLCVSSSRNASLMDLHSSKWVHLFFLQRHRFS